MTDKFDVFVRSLEAKIEHILQPKIGISTRYPYTYAYDFVRTHYGVFGFDNCPSRAEVSKWLRHSLNIYDDNDARQRKVCEILADAYLKENNTVIRI